MKKLLSTVGIALFFSAVCVHAQFRTTQTLEKGWKFTREDNAAFSAASVDDSPWQTVTVPHDWAIYGPFDKNIDVHKLAIWEDGQQGVMHHTGRTGGLPFTGVGWYRRTFTVPQFGEGKKVILQFDGAMSNAVVYVNGTQVGNWPNGYNTFYFDITAAVKKDADNTLAVRLENHDEQSRWYPGAGLYRNVHLTTHADTHIPTWGTCITTPQVSDAWAKINVRTQVKTPADVTNVELETIIKNPDGEIVATQKSRITAYDNDEFSQNLIVRRPKRWDVLQPNLYTAVSKLYLNGSQTDEYTTTFGIRTIEIIPDKGFFLNGKRTQFKGVCMHHDLGPLGGVANDAGIRRQIRILQDMGVNAIRTSHNMPAPELVKACNEMGMMLMAESFDEWKQPKVSNGYNKYFDQWAEKDLVNLIHHFRNDPSVVMWSIGNEIPEQHVKGGVKVLKFLQDICHREDPTRPVTQGINRIVEGLTNGFGDVMDVVGVNYHLGDYLNAYQTLPQGIILGAEASSTVSSRGVYKFPVQKRNMAKYPDKQASSYDLEKTNWANFPDDDFIVNEDMPFVIGSFIWTGFDYLGEPTPYYTDWPSHASYFGIVDLAGIPKDRYYLYRSVWNPDAETLHILPHWNWKGREGETTPIFVYTNYPAAELFINGKSQGKRTKTDTKFENIHKDEKADNFDRQKRYRLMWMDTKYEPGTVKVVAYDASGKAVAEKVMKTAGKPDRIVLEADRNVIKADGRDLSFVNVRIVDKDGNFCPTEEREISFKVTGAGTYKAAANGNSASLESFQAPAMKLFSGQLTALIQSAEKAGAITLEATAKGVKSGKITIQAK